jgi:LysR family transcriptional regulator, regulator of abg operon
VKLSHIRDFVAVIDNGSMSAASRVLGISQPSITKSIRSLERELQLQLVQRTTRGVVPTQYGRAFFLRAKAAQSELLKARQEIGQLAGSRAGFLAFGSGPVVADLILPQAVASFRKQFPLAEVRIFEGFAHTLIPLVRDTTLEFAVTARLPQFRRERGIGFQPLFFHDRVVVGRKGHPLAGARSLRDLVNTPWLSFEPRNLLEREFKSRALRTPASVILCESYTGFVRLLETSDMVGILPRSVLFRSPAREVLRALDIAETLPTLTVGLFSRPDTPLTPAAAAMAQAITAAGHKLARSVSKPPR